MRVIDSSAWVEVLADTEIAPKLLREWPAEQADIVIPSIVILEVSKWLIREADEGRLNRFLAYASQCAEVPLDTNLAVRAAKIHREARLATADAIVYATAAAWDAELLTCDNHFQGMKRTIYVSNKR